MTRAALAWLFVASATACGGPPMVPRTASLRLAGAPREATVIIDDQVIGSLAMVAAQGVGLLAGRHRITVEAPGFFPHDEIVEARLGDPPLHVKVDLVRVPE